MNNEEVVSKAITAADTLASAGKLNPQQANKFLDYVVDESVLKGQVRIERVKSETWEINKLGIGNRVAMAWTEGQDPGVRRGITTSKMPLTPKTFIVPIEIGDEFKEINLEGEAVVNHVLKIFGAKLANDLEDLCLNGDILGHAVIENDLLTGGSLTQVVKDYYLALGDGWLKKAAAVPAANRYNAGGANVGSSLFSEAIQKMPTKFRRNRRNLRFVAGSDIFQKWLEKLSTRATGEGDAALTSEKPSKPVFGVPMFEVPLLDLYPTVTKHLSLPGTTATSLGFAPIKSGSEIVTVQTLANVPTIPLVKDTAYTIDYTAGTIARKAGADPLLVKVTFQTYPRMLLTPMSNLLLAIGRDIRVEKGRNIFTGMDQYVISGKVAVDIEEETALVDIYNIGVGV